MHIFLLLLPSSCARSYAVRELSVEKDRVLAISGIAEKFAKLIPGGDAAGLWDAGLPLSLLRKSGEQDRLCHGLRWTLRLGPGFL